MITSIILFLAIVGVLWIIGRIGYIVLMRMIGDAE